MSKLSVASAILMFSCIACRISAFVGHHSRRQCTLQGGASITSCRLVPYLADRYYQLEEMEDRDTSTTELLFNSDNSVEFGDTDGPLPIEARGRWKLRDRDFAMIIERTFTTGQDGTDMGTFQYKTTRTFLGELTLIGDTPALIGQVFDASSETGTVEVDPPDDAIGYFNMIDATDARGSESVGSRSATS